MAKTKIFVFQMKEIIYTAIFAGLFILLIVLLVLMFGGSDDNKQSQTSQYKNGIYTSQIQLGNSSLNLEVTVEENAVKDVSLINLEESVLTMYPLVEPSVQFIEEELVRGTPPDKIQLTEKGKYTQTLLLEGVKNALSQKK